MKLLEIGRVYPMRYFRYIWLTALLLVSAYMPADGQPELKLGYHRAETVPTHGGMVAMQIPLSDQFRVLSLHVRGEAGYGRETATSGGWRAKRVDQMLSAGVGLGVAAKLWFVQVYVGMTGGVHRFMDAFRFVDRDFGATSLPSQEAERPGRSTEAALFAGYDEGYRRYVGRTVGLAIDTGSRWAYFVEYRERHVINWTGDTPPNPYRSVYAGFSLQIF